MVLWGETQSIFQLSFALNIAFYVIDEFRRPDIAEARRRLENTAQSLDQLAELEVPRRGDEATADYNKRKERIALDISHFLTEYVACNRALASYEQATVHKVMWVHLFSAAASLACLLYGTFHANVHLSNQYLFYLLILCVNPVFISIGIALMYRYRFEKSTALSIRNLNDNVSMGLFLLRNPQWGSSGQ